MPASPLKNVAIVTVHGVGNHEPRASATAIANLLLRTPREGPPHYTSFHERDLQIPTRPLAQDEPPAPPPVAIWKTLNERAAHPRTTPSKHPDHLLMASQLAHYDANDADGVYDTLRLEGHHIAQPAGEQAAGINVDANLHVYEFYWSDISRIGSSFFSVFGAFYQLVIHLPYIGRSTIEFARAAGDRASAIWSTLALGHTWAMRTLTLFIPVMNMVMLALGLALLVRHVPDSANPALSLTVANAVLATVTVVLATLGMYRTHFRWRGLAILVPLALGVSLIVWHPARDHGYVWLVFEAWVLMALALVAVLAAFQRVRPGALPWGIVFIAMTTMLMAAYARGAGKTPTGIVLPVLEWLYSALSLGWLIFGLGLLVVIVAGLVLSLRPSSLSVDADARAAYTARFALALPAIAFCTATLLVWGLLVAAESKTAFPNGEVYEPVFWHPALISHVRAVPGNPATGSDTTCVISGGTGTEVLRCSPAYFISTFAGALDTRLGVYATGASLLAILIAVLVMGPVVWTEIQSPHAPPERNPNAFGRRSTRLGIWLNFAFGAARVSGELLSVACLIGLVGLVFVLPRPAWLVAAGPAFLAATPNIGSGLGFLSYGGLLLGGASTLSVLAVVHWLSGAGAGLRPALGIATDVDNYMRELPADRTPRARLVERYASLLRYICDWRANPADPESGYDGLIIVAHSQGTIISADLLRYLNFERITRRDDWEPSLRRLGGDGKPLPIALFTMGSPLRQLYGQRFPHLYAWTSAPDANGVVGPDPLSLSIGRWVNAYRSADYVGRRLWGEPITDDASFDVAPSPSAEAPENPDACMGPGAHTHYWDESADWIASGLDRLVSEILAERIVHTPSPAAKT